MGEKMETKDIVLLLLAGVIVYILYRMFKKGGVVATSAVGGNVTGANYAAGGTGWNPAQLPDPRTTGYPPQGGAPATGNQGTSGAQDFQAIAGGIATLGGAAAQLGAAFGGGGFGSAGTGGDYGAGSSDSGGYSDGYDGSSTGDSTLAY